MRLHQEIEKGSVRRPQRQNPLPNAVFLKEENVWLRFPALLHFATLGRLFRRECPAVSASTGKEFGASKINQAACFHARSKPTASNRTQPECPAKHSPSEWWVRLPHASAKSFLYAVLTEEVDSNSEP